MPISTPTPTTSTPGRRAVREAEADAILAVHLYGLPARMDALQDIADDEGVLLVEDAAQTHRARYRGDPVGTVGDAAAFSFYPTKNMTSGEGGMVVTDREHVADRVAGYVNHGRTDDGGYTHVRVGHNYRMTSIAAAIGRRQLDLLPGRIRSRRLNARCLTAAVQEMPGLVAPVEPDDRRHAYNQYTVRCPERDRLRDRLADAGRSVVNSMLFRNSNHSSASGEADSRACSNRVATS